MLVACASDIGCPHDPAEVVHSRCRAFAMTRQNPQVLHRAMTPQESVRLARSGLGLADDFPAIADCGRARVGATQRSQQLQSPVAPQECTLALRRCDAADDVAVGVDSQRRRGLADRRRQVADLRARGWRCYERHGDRDGQPRKTRRLSPASIGNMQCVGHGMLPHRLPGRRFDRVVAPVPARTRTRTSPPPPPWSSSARSSRPAPPGRSCSGGSARRMPIHRPARRRSRRRPETASPLSDPGDVGGPAPGRLDARTAARPGWLRFGPPGTGKGHIIPPSVFATSASGIADRQAHAARPATPLCCPRSTTSRTRRGTARPRAGNRVIGRGPISL